MPNVLIAPAPLRNKPGPFRDLLRNAGFKTIDPAGSPQTDGSDLLPHLPKADAMLAGGEPMTDAMMDQAPALRVIARTGVGYDAVDVDAATRRKIAVAITPGTNHDSVAEHTFALILALARNIVVNDQIIKKLGGWDRTLVRPLRGSTLGVVGLGRIGKTVALRGLDFGMPVIAYDTIPEGDFEAKHGIRRVDLDTLLAESDVVSLHLPLMPETRGLFHKETFARMKRGALLVNTARGGLVVEDDLRESLLSGQLAGAGLDVLQHEPPDSDDPLLGLPNVIISPHIAGIDTKAMADMATLAAQTIVDLFEGRWPDECVVNRELRDGWNWTVES